MPALKTTEIADILTPFFPNASATLLASLSDYLDLLLKWNARTNLTSVREPQEIVRRHFGESLFLARHLPQPGSLMSFLDFGSGAGFPGIPVQLVHPGLHVTLAESQHKKAAFLREAVRTLGLQTEVWPGRVDALPRGKLFDVVALRAVDDMQASLVDANSRVAPKGWLAVLTTEQAPSAKDQEDKRIALPGSQRRVLMLRQGSAPMFHVEQ